MTVVQQTESLLACQETHRTFARFSDYQLSREGRVTRILLLGGISFDGICHHPMSHRAPAVSFSNLSSQRYFSSTLIGRSRIAYILLTIKQLNEVFDDD